MWGENKEEIMIIMGETVTKAIPLQVIMMQQGLRDAFCNLQLEGALYMLSVVIMDVFAFLN